MKDCCSPDIQNALAQVVASLKRQDGTTRLRDKEINTLLGTTYMPGKVPGVLPTSSQFNPHDLTRIPIL